MTRKRFSASSYLARLLEFDGRCADCDCKTGGSNGLDWDHIIPLEKWVVTTRWLTFSRSVSHAIKGRLPQT